MREMESSAVLAGLQPNYLFCPSHHSSTLLPPFFFRKTHFSALSLKVLVSSIIFQFFFFFFGIEFDFCFRTLDVHMLFQWHSQMQHSFASSCQAPSPVRPHAILSDTYRLNSTDSLILICLSYFSLRKTF